MDIDMPIMNGIEAVEKGKERYPNSKYLMLTIFDEDEKIFNAIKAGANGYLLKDEPIEKIKEAIVNLLNDEGAPMSPSIARKALNLLISSKMNFSTEKQDSFDKARSIQISKRSVYKYSIDGKFIEGFETQKEAELKHPYSNITKAIKLKSVCENNFMWSLEKLHNFNVPSKKVNSKKRVGKFDLNGILVKIYESATQADKENGTSVWKVLKGTNKTHKGHIYKYLDN
jgi:YesN/AraC family two-component response regulator